MGVTIQQTAPNEVSISGTETGRRVFWVPEGGGIVREGCVHRSQDKIVCGGLLHEGEPLRVAKPEALIHVIRQHWKTRAAYLRAGPAPSGIDRPPGFYRTSSPLPDGTTHIEVWYNRNARSWVLQRFDNALNQVGAAIYRGTRAGIEADLSEFSREVEALGFSLSKRSKTR